MHIGMLSMSFLPDMEDSFLLIPGLEMTIMTSIIPFTSGPLRTMSLLWTVSKVPAPGVTALFTSNTPLIQDSIMPRVTQMVFQLCIGIRVRFCLSKENTGFYATKSRAFHHSSAGLNSSFICFHPPLLLTSRQDR